MSDDKPTKGRKSVRSRASGKVAKVALDPDGKPMTQAQLHRFGDATVDEANSRIRRSGAELDGLCTYLFTACFGMDVESALDLAGRATAQYDLLAGRAGKSLNIKPEDLPEFVRIGALLQLNRSDAYKNLDFTKKLHLLPLSKIVDEDGNRDLTSFLAGIAYANGPNVGSAAVKEWVHNETKRKPGSTGRPRGMTMAAGRTFLKTGVKLGSATQRKSVAKSVNAAPVAARKAFVDDLDATIANLKALRGDIDLDED